MKTMGLAVLFVAILCPASLAQSENGSICMAPVSYDWPPTRSGIILPCNPDKLSLKIDAQKAISWPTKESAKIDDLDLAARHRVVISCGGKPQQSFSFRFSEYKASDLCLFINDLYMTAQLWDPKQNPAPWCKCNKKS